MKTTYLISPLIPQRGPNLLDFHIYDISYLVEIGNFHFEMCLMCAHKTTKGNIIIPEFFRTTFLIVFIFINFLYELLLVTPNNYA